MARPPCRRAYRLKGVVILSRLITVEIECKFYRESLGFAEVQPKLLAAWRDNKDCLLVVTTADLKNSCIDGVNQWIEGNGKRPRFRYWTGHDLARAIIRHAPVLQKYFGPYSATRSETLEQIVSQQRLVTLALQTRIERQIISLLSSARGDLAIEADSRPSLGGPLQKLKLVAAQLTALRFLDAQASPAAPAQMRIDIREGISNACDALQHRTAALTKSLPPDPVYARVSPQLLTATLYELLDNASRYGTSVSVHCSATTTEWTTEVTNPCTTTAAELGDFPRPGLRLRPAIAQNPSGTGHGCYMVKQLLTPQGISAAWTADGKDWKARLSGTRIS